MKEKFIKTKEGFNNKIVINTDIKDKLSYSLTTKVNHDIKVYSNTDKWFKSIEFISLEALYCFLNKEVLHTA